MIKRALILVLVAVSLNSCASQKVVFDESARVNNQFGYSANNTFLLWGALQIQQNFPENFCDKIENVQAIEVKKSFENVFLNIISGGIAQVHLYTPRTSVIYCKKI